MHIEIARNRSTLTNPHESEEHKKAARAALESVAADPSDHRQQDAEFVLRELDLTSDISTENVQPPNSDATGTETTKNDDSWKDLNVREVSYLGRLRNLEVECGKPGAGSSIYRYWLPEIYRILKSSCDSPSRGLAEAILGKYLPRKWLTRDLFSEMQEALKSDPTKSCFEQEPIAKRVAPYIDRWLKIKTDWEGQHGPTGECLADVLYCASTDHPEYAKVTA